MRFRHTFECVQCRQPLSFLSNNEDSEYLPGAGRPASLPSLFHVELHRALGREAEQRLGHACMGRLLWKSTDRLAAPPREAPPPPDDASHGEAILLAGRAQNADQPTRAVMWCNETRQWHYGRCRHGADPRGRMPDEIALRIAGAEVQVEADCYGANCAEVECVIKAYKAGRKATDLRGCRFIAYNITRAGWIDACLSCRKWIAAFGGSWRKREGGWT